MRKLRILRIWFYGKLKLAKRVRTKMMFDRLMQYLQSHDCQVDYFYGTGP